MALAWIGVIGTLVSIEDLHVIPAAFPGSFPAR
jgi:hypothetical protein